MYTVSAISMMQEHKAICQALRREVSRMHRQTAFKADHGARQRQSWDDAFAQVCIQPTCASTVFHAAYPNMQVTMTGW